MASTPSTRLSTTAWRYGHRVTGICAQRRGQGIGIAKAIVSLTLFHEGRIFITNQFKQHNLKKLEPRQPDALRRRLAVG